jgi:hypothetical protein
MSEAGGATLMPTWQAGDARRAGRQASASQNTRSIRLDTMKPGAHQRDGSPSSLERFTFPADHLRPDT